MFTLMNGLPMCSGELYEKGAPRFLDVFAAPMDTSVSTSIALALALTTRADS